MAGYVLKILYCLSGKTSKLSDANKILVYKAILIPIWTYGMQFWRTASNNNTEIFERFQSKALRTFHNLLVTNICMLV